MLFDTTKVGVAGLIRLSRNISKFNTSYYFFSPGDRIGNFKDDIIKPNLGKLSLSNNK